MNSEAAQILYGFVSAALMLGSCALISEYGMRYNVSNGKKIAMSLGLPVLLWAVVLAGAVWLFG